MKKYFSLLLFIVTLLSNGHNSYSQNKKYNFKMIDKKGEVKMKYDNDWANIYSAFLNEEDSVYIGVNSFICFGKVDWEPGDNMYTEYEKGKHSINTIINKPLSKEQKNSLLELGFAKAYFSESELGNVSASKKNDRYKDNNSAIVKAILNRRILEMDSITEKSDYNINLNIVPEDQHFIFTVSNNTDQSLFFDIIYIENNVIKSIFNNNSNYVSELLVFEKMSLNIYFNYDSIKKMNRDYLLIAYEKPFQSNKLSSLSRRMNSKKIKSMKVGFDIFHYK